MHIRKLGIQNVACFDDVTFDFTNDYGALHPTSTEERGFSCN